MLPTEATLAGRIASLDLQKTKLEKVKVDILVNAMLQVRLDEKGGRSL